MMPCRASASRMQAGSMWIRVPPASKKIARNRGFMGSEEDRLTERAKHLLEGMPDLEERAVGANAFEHRLHDVLTIARGLLQRLQARCHTSGVARGAQLRQPFALLSLRLLADPEDVDVGILRALGKTVDTDHEPLAALD